MTCLIGRTGIAAALCLLIVAPLAHGAGPTPLRVLPNQNVIAPQRNMTQSSVLTEYVCPPQISVSWPPKLANYVAGGWSEVPFPPTMVYVFHGPAWLSGGQITCDYLPGWYHGNPGNTASDVLLSQSVQGSCRLRPDGQGVECRK
jgi:hypothetical protein